MKIPICKLVWPASCALRVELFLPNEHDYVYVCKGDTCNTAQRCQYYAIIKVKDE